MPKLTPKQVGDACEWLVAAELTLSGVPTMKAPDLWRGYDLVAQPADRSLQKISVKGRTFKKGAAIVEFSALDDFDWLAIVILPGGDCHQRRIFILPGQLAMETARRYVTPNLREYRIDEVADRFAGYENNFLLSAGEYGTPDNPSAAAPIDH